MDLALCESCDGFYKSIAKFHVSRFQTLDLCLHFRKISSQHAYSVICVPVVTVFSTYAMHCCILLLREATLEENI